MTPLLRTRRPGRHRAARTAATRPARRAHRVGYAAAGLLALTGSVATPVARVGATTGVAAHAGADTARRPAGRPLLVRATSATSATSATVAGRGSRERTRPPRRATRTRWVAGPVLRGRATWYGPGFAGRRTASGEVFRPDLALTAAHRTLPFGTRLRVCRGRRCVVVRVNDRGPFGPAILDLSWLAARRIGLDRVGIGPVTATVLRRPRT